MTSAMIPTLKTDRLVLRPYHVDDFATYAAFMASDRAKFMDGPYSQSQSWDAFSSDTVTWQFFGYGTFAIEIDGALAGFVGLINPPHFPEPECGWGLYDGFTGRGIVTEAARAVLDHTFATTDLQTIVSYIDPANHASQKVAERLGGVRDPNAASPFGPKNDVYRYTKLGEVV